MYIQCRTHNWRVAAYKVALGDLVGLYHVSVVGEWGVVEREPLASSVGLQHAWAYFLYPSPLHSNGPPRTPVVGVGLELGYVTDVMRRDARCHYPGEG